MADYTQVLELVKKSIETGKEALLGNWCAFEKAREKLSLLGDEREVSPTNWY
ncbi:MAG: hypothetical protein JRJ13_19755 [Deltaproteobacteria bacterium]|nr:hypothetical protein [Deltaproteobacteria bacterium]